MDNIKNVLEEVLKKDNLVIDDIKYENETLYIVVDTIDDTIINLDRIVDISKLISSILDKYDFIKNKYVLDVSSKEKGVK